MNPQAIVYVHRECVTIYEFIMGYDKHTKRNYTFVSPWAFCFQWSVQIAVLKIAWSTWDVSVFFGKDHSFGFTLISSDKGSFLKSWNWKVPSYTLLRGKRGNVI